MSLLESILMGIIQGVTEFLPVSSSGHLAIFKALFHIEEPGMLFDVLLHIGTLVAVFIVYFKDLWRMIAEFFLMRRDFFCNVGIFFKNHFGRARGSGCGSREESEREQRCDDHTEGCGSGIHR